MMDSCYYSYLLYHLSPPPVYQSLSTPTQRLGFVCLTGHETLRLLDYRTILLTINFVLHCIFNVD